MQFVRYKNRILNFLLISCIFCVHGCHNIIVSPNGFIAEEQSNLLLTSFITMLIIIFPVMIMTILFSIRYRENNITEKYTPKWSHSHVLEWFIWGIPIIIIVFLSILSWRKTHDLDPNRPIISNVNPIVIQVVSLDWKWLFIYPYYKVAIVNQLVIPVNTPIIFHLTSNSVMNSFFIPLLGSQIYVMPGMQTNLHLITNKSGEYTGISSNYSGKGFSNMKFNVLVMPNHTLFYQWINAVKMSVNKLNSSSFNKLSQPSDNNNIEYYSNVSKGLFYTVIEHFTKTKYNK